MEIPPNWDRMSEEEAKKHNDRGRKEIESTLKIDSAIKTDSAAEATRTLINLKKNHNAFFSTTQPSTHKNNEDFTKSESDLAQVVKTAFEAQGMKCDITNSETMISGLLFQTTLMKIQFPKFEGGYTWHSRIINGSDFSMGMFYADSEGKAAFEDIIATSVFKQ